MSKYDSKEISYATMHGHIHHPETGQFGPTLQNWSDTARKATKMTLCEPWVLVEVPAQKNPKKIIQFLVPVTGFIHTVLAE